MFVKLSQLANKLPLPQGKDLTRVETPEDEKQKQKARKQAVKVMHTLTNMVAYVAPEQKSRIDRFKQAGAVNMLKELTQPGGSTMYEELVERVCDDLLENVNNSLDMYKRQDNPESAVVVK